MKKYINLFILFIFISVFVIFGLHENSENYKKLKEIKYNIVSHPELLPKKELARISSFGFANVRADFYRLEAIQYIGGNAISAEYKKYLYSMLDIITELNPYFEHPYVIGELLLPEYNERYENRTKNEQNNNIKQAELIAKKGIENFCDKSKVEAIKNEFDLKKLWTEDKYKNPCKSSIIPYYLAFIYYFYNHDAISRAYYYKVTSANEDSLEGAKIMAAIMQGKGGDREKSIIMFLNMAKSVENNELCSTYSTELQKILLGVFNGNFILTGDFMKQVENKRKMIENVLDKGNKSDALDDTKCINYINKSVREINLYYAETANKKYFKDTGKNAKNVKELYDKKYIDYFPKDFQKVGSDSEIIYEYNNETGNFDYRVGNY
ncbi:MAG: hypothetical protein PHR68_02460 [Candidatus Gracilibacteria bacterium]|nr:hypothetical protein [Candidatus Gracilibacteria bacterium]